MSPIRLTAAGQSYPQSCRVVGIIWTGVTTIGDQVVLKGNGDSQLKVIWDAMTDTTSTYLGAMFGRPGLHVPDGFRADVLMSGQLYIYLAE